jgi:hypothetical protein
LEYELACLIGSGVHEMCGLICRQETPDRSCLHSATLGFALKFSEGTASHEF